MNAHSRHTQLQTQTQSPPAWMGGSLSLHDYRAIL